ncbi:hypothetical protein B4W97_002692 [Salmonella enterica subsp. enterica serovar Ohio]|uniref:Uncharacterized protein n=8 Tax=Salmonella enterica TaxID=28901 RepID=A0A736CBC9_SALMU|nr:hypothetical protein [Salmonella enterica subsp. enterica]EDN4150335.1 hypothetical protein [Salmonella enterica subsp. enterica serovar Kenya]EDN4343675.1 hypothetical protein [Salmonella enterica subsp. enterica serovar Mikawasima]EDN4367829.1 hypothetical protein [Salmonella enterica subsp. enterica serovar Virginia]EDN4507697.1 hypothetical protein [Salmonella enterica subsp. enterica serovar Livingstone]EDN4671500.1 hypothetical protein [Salmonella enterica subsp. enterica serovar Live
MGPASDSRGRLFEFRINLALSLRKMCLIAFLAGKKALHLLSRKKYFIINEINK